LQIDLIYTIVTSNWFTLLVLVIQSNLVRKRIMSKEATARIKINKLLEAAGWRFFGNGKSPANVQLEPSVTLKTLDLDALGDNFEKAVN